MNNYLRKNKIDSKIHYPIPLHLHDAAKKLKYKPGDYPNAERFSKNIISLPVHEFVTKNDLDLMIRKIRNFYKKIKIIFF